MPLLPAFRRRPGIGRSLVQAMALVGLCVFLLPLSLGQTKRPHQDDPDAPIRIVTAVLPPHMNERGEGREAEIIEAALASTLPGQRIEFFVLPFSRHWDGFVSDTRFDAVTTVPATTDLQGFRSQPYIAYQNGIGYRCDAFGPTPPSALASLDGRRVVGFAGAEDILPGLAAAVDDFARYTQRRNQFGQVSMLLERQVDAVIADGAILRHYAGRIAGESGKARVGFLPLFEATDYHMVFRSERVRDAFDHGLSRLGKRRRTAIDARFYPSAEENCR
jgi:ABC-type amino acid transport substrate-binding protein